MSSPFEQHDNLTVTFQSPYFQKNLFFEWLKTVGTIFRKTDTGRPSLKLPGTLDDGILFKYRALYTGGASITFDFRSEQEKKELLQSLRVVLKKASACVGCQACEAECQFGAIMCSDSGLAIDSDKCVKCHACYKEGNSCWRYRSMSKPDKVSGIANEFGQYYNFGFREDFVTALVDWNETETETFFDWSPEHPLGDKKVDACKKWFPQALLVTEDRKSTKLLELFRMSSNKSLAWDFVWMGLVNKSRLMKWYCVSTRIDERWEVQKLLELLKESYPLTNNAKDRRLDALKNTADSSPLGGETNAVMFPERKGGKIVALTRKTKDVHPLTILYGLYLIAHLSERNSFTVRELLTAGVDSVFVSPIVAFGIEPDTFKRQCEGLRTRYPDYISTTFTHGNDGLDVYSEKHSFHDVVNLVLEALQ